LPAPTLFVIHGPNLNLLGVREPHIYGTTTLAEIDEELARRGQKLGVQVVSFQSNIEGELVTQVQRARGTAQGILINPGGYTHTSVAIRDAIEAAEVPAVEVHLSNLHRREPFRRRSFVAGVCLAQVAGFGAASYYVALDGLCAHLRSKGLLS